MKNWQITGFLAVLIIGFLLICECTSTSVTPTANPTPKYKLGDIAALNDTDTLGILILDYNVSQDNYTARMILQKTDNSWGYFVFDPDLPMYETRQSKRVNIDNNFSVIRGHISDPTSIKTLEPGDIPPDVALFRDIGIYQMMSSPTLTVAPLQYPIIGVWEETSPGNSEVIRFNADGTFISSFRHDEDDYICDYGTWSTKGSNLFETYSTPRYKVSENASRDERLIEMYKYDPAKKTIRRTIIVSPSINFDVIYAPYQGDVEDRCIPPTPVSVEGEVQIISKYTGWKSYGDFYVSGVLRNNLGRSVIVIVNVDAYDANDVKVGSGYDSVTIDSYGKSKFEAIAFGENGSSRSGKYRVYINKIL